MTKPKMIGTINGFVGSPFAYRGKRGLFDGTLKGLCLAAQRVGAKAGDVVKADFGSGHQAYKLEAAPHDPRANGLWPVRS